MERRFLVVVAVVAVGLLGVACSDDESSPTIDPDTPVSSVDAEVVDAGGDEAPTSPGTLTVTGADGDDADGSDPAAPDGQVPDRSTVPPASAGAGDDGGGGGGADAGDPPDVSTQPSG